jgi:ribosome-associated toxin RatA of RatAB toxin-antitoxin module
MAMKESREILIDASPDAILAVLADVEALPSWSPVHKRVEVIDTHPDGRPHHVRMTVRVMGITDQQLLEYKWGPDWVVWDAVTATRERAQHAEYTLERGLEGTRVRFDLTFDPIR